MEKKEDLLGTKVDRLAKVVVRGFKNVDSRLDTLENRVERGFSAVAEDIEGLRTELKGDIAKVETELKGDIARVDSRIGAIDNRIDNETFARKDLESRVRKVVPKLQRASEHA